MIALTWAFGKLVLPQRYIQAISIWLAIGLVYQGFFYEKVVVVLCFTLAQNAKIAKISWKGGSCTMMLAVYREQAS